MPTQTGKRTAATAPDTPAESLWFNRDFQALWISRLLAAIGKEAAEIAYPLLILATTGSATYAGAVGSAQLVTNTLMSLAGGAVGDRFDRRRIMVICDLARIGLLGVLAALVATGRANVWLIAAIAVGSAAFLGISNPVALAAIKQLVPRSQLTRATAQNQVRFFGATVVGPPIGGALFGVARALPFLAAAATFLGGALLLVLVRAPMQRAAEARPADRKRVIEGFRFMRREPIVGLLIIWITGSNMAFNHTGAFLAVLATANERGAPGALTGVALSIAGAGGLVGAVLSGWALRRVSPSTLILWAAWVGPAAAVLLALTPGVLPLGVILGFVFVRAPITNALFFGYIAALAPDEVQGRVLGAVTFMSLLAQPVGVFTIGAAIDQVGPTWVFAAMGLIATVAALPTLTRRIRSLPRPEEVGA